VELVPGILAGVTQPTKPLVKAYSPLELEGRDIYIREGCNNCHSQMIRPFRSETVRYGAYSEAGDYVYEHPFLWGSKRTGPDLLREGGKYPNTWHYNHMLDPRSTSPGSIMPKYPWLYSSKLDLSNLSNKMRVLQKLGVPYSDVEIVESSLAAERQAQTIVADLAQNKITVAWDDEIVALIAYLQALGKRVAEPETGQAQTKPE
jgi:cytochrome c oxidase cbb3-type subunit I/II